MERAEFQAEHQSLAETITGAVARLTRAGVENPRLDAELLVAEACGLARAGLLVRRAPLTAVECSRFAAMLARRERREPFAYIVGRKEFLSLDFEVSPAVLMPRPETETLLQATLEVLPGLDCPAVLDIGTGSGAIAVALAVYAPHLTRIVATDVSNEALSVARRNATIHRCADRIRFVEADLFPPGMQRFDLVVSNPPYIQNQVIDELAPEIARFEPRLALEGGEDGLDFYRRIADGAANRLATNGVVMVEVGAGQAAQVTEIFRRAGLHQVTHLNDLSGVERVVRARA